MSDGDESVGAGVHASSTSQAMTAVGWLDLHFEASRPEYEAQLRAVGLQPGWRVLDAACGGGSFLPWLADIVGPGGGLAALDLAPDNVATVQGRLAEWGLGLPVETKVGTVLALPYPDDHFDAAWFANSSQYLADGALATALAEFRRVVRPGGLVALKESDLVRILPAPPGLSLRHAEAAARVGNARLQGFLRAPTLPAWLRRAGLDGVWRRLTLIEHAAPLPPMTRHFLRAALAAWADEAAGLDLPEADRACWAAWRDPAALERLLDDPDVYLAESNILAVGRVPGG